MMIILIRNLVITIFGDYTHHNIKLPTCRGNSLYNLSSISNIIRSQRKKKKWSQQQLAEYAGLNRTTIGSIERGDYSDVGIRKIERILSLFNKSLAVQDNGLPTLDQLNAQNNKDLNG